MTQKFNPHDWLQTNGTGGGKGPDVPSNISAASNPDNDIELVISRIEAACTDITGSYADWLNIGFALADEFGEGGRDYYHRISRYYPKYSLTDCNRQFDQCLKAQGHGITIKTVFHLAKQAGIDVTRQGAGSREQEANSQPLAPGSLPLAPSPEAPAPDSDSEPIELPTFPTSVYSALPEFLQKVVARCRTNAERDVMLLGALVTMSSCFPKVFGFYDETRVFANLFLYVTAQASAGKGRLMLCKRLVNPIHWALRKETQAMRAQYEIEMREYNLNKGKDFKLEKPEKPAERMLFIPANNSTTGVFQLLSDNEGKGLIFETEGDTLSQAFKSDYGNYSDGFRKAFHHETISYYRRTDHEYVEIDYPCMSTVLSSTPKQVATLIPNAENGLLSRFIFYNMNIKAEWKNMFPRKKDKDLDVYFDNLGQEFFPLYKALNENPAIEFSLTEEQQDQFHVFFTQIQDKYLMLQGMDYMATIRRLGLICFRIAMCFTMIRILETGDFSQLQLCSEVDFQATLSMIKILIKHSSHVYSELPADVTPAKPKDRKEQFLDKLPKSFTRQDYHNLAKSISILARTADRYMTSFCDKGLIVREQQGTFSNPGFIEEEE